MRRPLVVLAVAVFTSTGVTLGQTASELRQHAEDSGCVITPLSCGLTLDGTLAAGDCTSSVDGSFEDFYEFVGTAGQVVDLLVYPIDATMNPRAFLLPPPGDASDTPIAIGGRGVWMSYVLASTGKWAVVVSGASLFSSGRYKVGVVCGPDNAPNQPQSCISQELVCGQTIAWSLSSQSCRFASATNRLFGPYEIYAVGGDILTLKESSSAFTPLFGVYDSRGSLLASSAVSGHDATYNYLVPVTGFYYVNATSTTDLAIGGYSLSVGCNAATSGCMPPAITREPADQQITPGRNATVSVGATGVGALTYTWYDATAGLPTFITQTNTGSYTFNSVNASIAVYSVVATACGQVTSRVARISAVPPRGRAVRH